MKMSLYKRKGWIPLPNKTAICEWIDKHESKHIKLLQQLVQQASTQGNEKRIQEIVAKHLHKLDMVVDMWDLNGERLQNHDYFYSNRKDFANSPNVVGVLKGTGGGKSIILNGHVDVVPEGDHEQWEEEPYSGVIKDGKMFGRGVTDMKGGNVALLIAIEAIQTLNVRLKGDIIFQSVVEEESGGAGTLDAIIQGYQADAAIIPEPTNMKMYPKQQGSKWFRLIITGRTAHGGTPYLGVNAIDKAFIVNNHIKELEKVRNERITDPLYDNIPVPIPINIGSIQGGEWPSSVPDVVTLEGRIGIAPHETMEEAQAEMEQSITSLKMKDEWFKENPVQLEWFGARWLPGEIDTNHPLMDILSKNFTTVIGEEPEVEASPWGTDGGLLAQVAQTPSIIFGPGITELAHYPNEAIELKKITEAAKVIATTVLEWCEENEV